MVDITGSCLRDLLANEPGGIAWKLADGRRQRPLCLPDTH